MKGMNVILWCLLVVYLLACGPKQSLRQNDSILIIDIDKRDYPIEDVDINAIADVEYIPLETTDESIIPNGNAGFYVTDSLIITSSIHSGEVFFFDRKGSFLYKVCRLGNSGKEYSRLSELIVDFVSKELLVYSAGERKIQIYDFDGDYQRTLRLPTDDFVVNELYNYDDDYLIGCNYKYSYLEKKHADNHPYYLISKKNGNLINLPLFIEDRIDFCVNREVVTFSGGAYSNNTYFKIDQLNNNGTDMIIGDFALDTIYCYRDYKLTPIALKIPPVKSKNPRRIVAVEFVSDYFIRFRIIDMVYIPDAPQKPFDESPELVWDKRGKRFRHWKVYDYNYSTKIKPDFPRARWSDLPRNYGVSSYRAEKLIEQYEKGELKGKLKEVASKLKEDDNRVVILCKYK